MNQVGTESRGVRGQPPAAVYSLRRVGHGEAHGVTAGHGEENHDEGEGGVVGEDDGQVGALLDVTEHQQGDEDHPGDHQGREHTRLFTRLQGRRERGNVQFTYNPPTWVGRNCIKYAHFSDSHLLKLITIIHHFPSCWSQKLG